MAFAPSAKRKDKRKNSDFKVPQRSIHKVCEQRNAENRCFFSKTVELSTAPNRIKDRTNLAWEVTRDYTTSSSID